MPVSSYFHIMASPSPALVRQRRGFVGRGSKALEGNLSLGREASPLINESWIAYLLLIKIYTIIFINLQYHKCYIV